MNLPWQYGHTCNNAAMRGSLWILSGKLSTKKSLYVSLEGKEGRLRAAKREEVTPSPPRIFAVSDLHTDYSENLDWCFKIDGQEHQNDILLVAGDVSDNLERLEATLSALNARFGAVFYTPGNHELWVRSSERDAGIETSWEKLKRVLATCGKLGIRTRPCRVANTLIFPIHSWHHSSFDQEPNVPGVPSPGALTIADYAACDWRIDPQEEEDQTNGSSEVKELNLAYQTQGSIELAKAWDDLNETTEWKRCMQTRGKYGDDVDVIGFAHFLPFQHCLPEKRFLFYPNLAAASGSNLLGERVNILRPDILVFGHSHFAWDATVGGTRFIQAPLCSPSERKRRLGTIAFDDVRPESLERPVEARWLPLEIYTFNDRFNISTYLPNETYNVSFDIFSFSRRKCLEDLHKINDTFLSIYTDTDIKSVFQEGLVADSVILDDLTACNEAAHGSTAIDVSDDPFEETSVLSMNQEPTKGSDAMDIGSTSKTQRQDITNAGFMPVESNHQRIHLRNGDCPGHLGAHWSDYYALHPRRPDIIEMAPWVARAYDRRRERQERS